MTYDNNSNSVSVGKTGRLKDSPKVVTIRNKYHPIYMPMAGGIGLKNYYKTAFFALMILSTLAIAITIRLRRKCL